MLAYRCAAVEQIQRVLVAVDLGADGSALTPGSRKAFARAAWISRRVGAALTVLHSDRPDEHWEPATGQFVQGLDGIVDRARILEEAVGEFARGISDVSVLVRSESAWLAVVREVLRRDIDIVLAAKRTTVESDDRKLGTVARKLLRKCPCAVWLEDPRESQDPSVIVAATDLTAVGDRVVELSASVAGAFGAELHVVHAFSLPMSAQLGSEPDSHEFQRRQHDAAVEHIGRILATTPVADTAQLHVGLTSPTQAIVESVERLEAGLVVMGTASRSGISGLLVGNTAERLFDRIDCALLTVKPKGFVCPVTLEQTEPD